MNHRKKKGLAERTLFFWLVNKDGVVSPRIMYGLWWLVGLLPLVYDQIARHDRRPPQWDLVQQVIRRVYLIAPWLMLVAHLGFSHWAHHSDFYAADLGPVLLGLAIASTRVRLDATLWLCARVLPALALLLTLITPAAQLQWIIGLTGDQHQVLPAHLAIAATMLTYGYMTSMFQFFCSFLAVSLLGFGYVFQGWIALAMRNCLRFLGNMLPDSLISWGITAIVAAFVFLGIGSILGLRRTADSQPKPPTTP